LKRSVNRWLLSGNGFPMAFIPESSQLATEFAEAFAVMTFQAGFNTALVVVGTTCLGVAAGVIGTFSLLRKRALMADALAHSSLPGLAIAFILGSLLGIGGKQLWLLLSGAAISGILGVLIVQGISRATRIQEDCAIAAVLSVFFGAGVVLLSIIQGMGSGEEGGLHHFIYGQTAAMTRGDALLTLVAAVATIVVCTLTFKEFRLICFDRGFAAATGWPISTIDLAMMAMVILITVVGLQSVGILLIVALLVIPPAGARFWTNRVSTMIPIAGCIGGVSGYLGSITSALLPGIPVGAVIVLVAGGVFFFSMIAAPTRGLLGSTARHLWMRVRISEDHLLRGIYEGSEQLASSAEPHPGVPLDNLALTRHWNWLGRLIFLSWCRSRGWIEIRRDRIHPEGTPDKEEAPVQTILLLTPRGWEQAGRRVRNHRLWEEYLTSFTDVPLSHVDYSADLVEHSLSPAIIAQLEASLAARKGAAWLLRRHRSIHPLDGAPGTRTSRAERRPDNIPPPSR
jgi:manganese/zinc/iron transport system permease protein